MRETIIKAMNHNSVVPICAVISAAIFRLIPHPANVAPIAAMALFGGVYLPRRMAVVLPLAAMLLSDFVLGFHQSLIFVYGSFVMTVLLGMWLRNHKTIPLVLGTSLVSSTLFFLITNFGFWLTDSLYPKTFIGQLEAYYLALPFFRNTILGDLFYTGVFFGGYELVKRSLQKREVLKA